ncbi:MAG: ABC transporter ATP-binding protein [Pseudomonadota bacterium]
MESQTILQVRDLAVEFDAEAGCIRAVDQVGFELKKGRVLGIAGESGCGKSVTALSIMRLLPKPVSRIVSGQIMFHNQDILDLPVEQMHHIRGRKISMIFQEPMTALNPVHTIGKQIIEIYKLHFSTMSDNQMKSAAISMLEEVGIADPVQVMKKYPHQLSGGMRQRVMIAMALACEPEILIADEPTTALDVTVQAQILDLIRALQKRSDMSVILITHDLGVIAENCDDVVVMYAGRIAEQAEVKILYKTPAHPYTQGLLSSIPSLSKKPKSILPTIQGSVPSLLNMPEGCRFAGRCFQAEAVCRKTIPLEREIGKGHTIACHFA